MWMLWNSVWRECSLPVQVSDGDDLSSNVVVESIDTVRVDEAIADPAAGLYCFLNVTQNLRTHSMAPVPTVQCNSKPPPGIALLLSRQKKKSPKKTKLQAICQTNAHLLIRILHEHHVRKMNYSTNKVQVSHFVELTQSNFPDYKNPPHLSRTLSLFPDLSWIWWHFQVSQNSREVVTWHQGIFWWNVIKIYTSTFPMSIYQYIQYHKRIKFLYQQ